MIAIFLMGIETVLSLFFLIQLRAAGKICAAEVALSRGWGIRFERQILEEKKSFFISQNEKYRYVSEKAAKKKIKEWEKQITIYQKKENAYLSGKEFGILDSIATFGYQLMAMINLDGNSELFRKLTACCEHTGYIELERTQETGDRKNSAIYAYYILASFVAYTYVGVLLAVFSIVLMLALGNSSRSVIIVAIVLMFGSIIYGYLPYDSLQNKAKKRTEELDIELPDAISKITLLVMAGMNITKALEETAQSADGLFYRELRIVLNDINLAASVQQAMSRLQCRCDNKYLDKMVSIIAKSYVAGNSNLASDLKKLNDDCWMDKKHNARRMGEAVQNKLFVPTMLMFIGVLVVIIVPAMAGFNL